LKIKYSSLLSYIDGKKKKERGVKKFKVPLERAILGSTKTLSSYVRARVAMRVARSKKKGT